MVLLELGVGGTSTGPAAVGRVLEKLMHSAYIEVCNTITVHE